MENNIIEYPIHPMFEKRKSIRSFSSKPISSQQIKIMFEAARWSFSSSNEQAWRFIYGINNDIVWQKLFDSLMDGNKNWCEDVPMLVLTLAKKVTSRGSIYKHNFYDTGAATMLLTLQAVEMGLQVHPMGGFYIEKIADTFAIPEYLEPVVLLAIGYPDSESKKLSEKQLISENKRGSRLTQDDFVLNNSVTNLIK
jgi:nitroreductase